MSNHENLAKQNNQKLTGANLKHKFRVVSGMSLGDVGIAERTVHFGHGSQMPKFQLVAVESLRVQTGLPVDVFVRPAVIDLSAWKKENKVGEYYRSPDGGTFTYTEVVEERGSERVEAAAATVYVETVAFTNMSRADVMISLGEPEKQAENNLIPLPQRNQLLRTG